MRENFYRVHHTFRSYRKRGPKDRKDEGTFLVCSYHLTYSDQILHGNWTMKEQATFPESKGGGSQTCSLHLIFAHTIWSRTIKSCQRNWSTVKWEVIWTRSNRATYHDPEWSLKVIPATLTRDSVWISNDRVIDGLAYAWPFSVFTPKQVCQISTDLDKIFHTPIVVRNTLVSRLRLRSARGRLQAKPERLSFCNTCNAP